MSGRPSPFTSATAAPVCQPNVPNASMPAACVPFVNVPSPLFQSSTLYVFVVTSRSVWPSPLKSPATQPFALHGEVRVRRACSRSTNRPSRRSRRARFAAGRRRRQNGAVRVRVRVDGEEVEPAVVVVVEPAEPAAHHPVHLVRHPEREVVLAEVEPDLRRDVREPDAVEAFRDGVDERHERDGPAAPHVRDDPAAVVLLELERLVQRRRRGLRTTTGGSSLYVVSCTVPSSARPRSPGPGRARPRDACGSGRRGTRAPRSSAPRPRSPAARSACCSSPTVAVASASDCRADSAAVSARRSATRSAAISRDVVVSSLLSTPFDGRIAIGGSGPGRMRRSPPSGARHTMPPRDERRRVDRERDARRRARAGAAAMRGSGRRSTIGRAAQTTVSEARIATFVAYSVCSGAIISAASRPTPTPYASRARCPRGVVRGSVIMKNRKMRISGDVSSTRQRYASAIGPRCQCATIVWPVATSAATATANATQKPTREPEQLQAREDGDARRR